MFKHNRALRAFLVGMMSIGVLTSSVSAISSTTRSFQATEIHRAPDAPSIWDSSPNVTRKEYLNHSVSAAAEVPPKPITLPHKPRITQHASRSRHLASKSTHASVDMSKYPYYARPHAIYYSGSSGYCPPGPSWVMDLAREITIARFGAAQWPSQRRLIIKESNGNPWCMNLSGAYGGPQAKPGSKMGPNWRYDVKQQFEWMCDYEKGRYGDPDGAMAHSRARGWY